MADCRLFRGEQWEFTFATETTYGGETSPANTYVTQVPGIFEVATLPDPNYDWQPFYGYGDESGRNYYRMYKGKAVHTGSVGDIQLLNGVPMRYGLGKCLTEGTDKSGGGSTLNGAVSAGATSIVLADAASYIAGDLIQIGVYTPTGNWAEVREILSVAGAPTVTLTYPLSYDHATAEVCNEVQAPFTHTIIESIELPSMCWLATFVGTDYVVATPTTYLTRRYLGGKVNRTTFTAAEGETLRMSWDDVIFKDWRHNQEHYVDSLSASHDVAKYLASVDKVTPDYPTTEPYWYSYGVCTYFGFAFARVKQFRMEVSNNLEPKYYLASSSSAGQILYEIREGRREYRISTVVDIGDEAVATKMSIIKELALQGAYPTTSTQLKGFNMQLVFTRGSNDTITFSLPASAAAIGGDANGCFIRTAPHNIGTEPQVASELDIIARSSKIVVVDSEYLYV